TAGDTATLLEALQRRVATATGPDDTAAEAAFEEGLRLGRASGNASAVSILLFSRGINLCFTKAYAPAEAILREAEAIARSCNLALQPNILAVMAFTALVQGHVTEAHQHIEDAQH